MPLLMVLSFACRGPSSGDTPPQSPDPADSSQDTAPALSECEQLRASGPELAQSILDMPADSWMQLPDTKMRHACPRDRPDIEGTGGCAMVVAAWGGASFDQARQQLIVWGGGHSDYYGNEVYAFDVLGGQWSLLTQPSAGPPDQALSQDPLADGLPISRHTYDGLVYLPGEGGRVLAHGGSMAGSGAETRVTWGFDIESSTWSQWAPEGGPGFGHAYNLSSGFDPETQTVLFRDPYYVHGYSLEAGRWEILLESEHSWGAQSGVVAPERRLFFSLGAGELAVYDIQAGVDVSSEWATAQQPGLGVVRADGPGLAYDPVSDALIAWAGGAPWMLSLETKEWTELSLGGPSRQQTAGTFGRWAYMDTLNAYVLVNQVSESVWIYKLSPGCVSK